VCEKYFFKNDQHSIFSADQPCMGKSRLPDDLIKQLVATMGGKLNTMSDIEDAIEELKAQIGQQSVDNKLHNHLPENNRPKKCPRCGRMVRVRIKNQSRTIESITGTHTIRRNYHYCDHCEYGFCPRDAELGLPSEGTATLKLEGLLLDFAVSGPYERSSERWNVHYPYRQFSANMFRQVQKRVGRRLELSSPKILQKQLAPSPTGKRERLYVPNDGSMLPGMGCWKEAKVGVLVRGENYLTRDGGKRGYVTQARYVAVWGEQDEFKESMRAALDVERWQRFKQIFWLGDGAKGNWILASSLAPTAVQILDPTHAIENGMKCGRALLGEGHRLLADWQRRITQLIYAGDVDTLVRELMECWLPDADMPSLNEVQIEAINAVIGYYRNNQSRMHYPEYMAQGLMIGSGIAEAAHRHVLQERMKLSGQHWSERYGRQMVALRAAYKTAGAKQFHHAINKAACITYLDIERQRRAIIKRKNVANPDSISLKAA
jgi:hypothetical protein